MVQPREPSNPVKVRIRPWKVLVSNFCIVFRAGYVWFLNGRDQYAAGCKIYSTETGLFRENWGNKRSSQNAASVWLSIMRLGISAWEM